MRHFAQKNAENNGRTNTLRRSKFITMNVSNADEYLSVRKKNANIVPKNVRKKRMIKYMKSVAEQESGLTGMLITVYPYQNFVSVIMGYVLYVGKMSI